MLVAITAPAWRDVSNAKTKGEIGALIFVASMGSKVTTTLSSFLLAFTMRYGVWLSSACDIPNTICMQGQSGLLVAAIHTSFTICDAVAW